MRSRSSHTSVMRRSAGDMAMFETAELGRTTSGDAFKKQEPFLRTGLLTVQYELRDADFPVVMVIAGTDRLGADDVINLLHEWMDARYIEANVFEAPTEEELEQPQFWRYWRALPPKGKIGVFHREWTTRAIVDRVKGKIDDAGLDERLRHIETFEKALVDDGAVVLKVWLHLSERELARRLEEAGRDDESWKITSHDRFVLRRYRRVQRIAEQVLRRTSVGRALWTVVESADWRYRNVVVAQTLIQTLTRRLAEPARPLPHRPAPASRQPNPLTILDQLDLTKTLDEAAYEKKQNRYWARLAALGRRSHKRGLSSVVLFEGWDAAGKGGAIRRLTKPLDASRYRVVPVAAPSDEERAHHYLWRFWRRLPRAGHWTIFDRSWYGRVLVERLEGFATEEEWRRANDFEEMLVSRGILLLKFWLHLSPREQLRRFKARENVPFKKYKISSEDYRNRDRWNAYELAADEMVQRTSTDYARWHLVAGNDKRWARIHVLKTVCRELANALE
jgi:polyphosphate:AMP phosphotransferase